MTQADAADYRIASDLNLEKLQQILKHKPDDSSLLFALGELALRRGRNLTALSAFTRLLELNPKLEEVHVALARLFIEQKLFQEAFREIAETLELDSGNVPSRILYDLLIKEASPSPDVADRIKSRLRNSLDSRKVKAYLQQLMVERDLLANDEREVSAQLAGSPGETFLEYSQALAARKLAQIEQYMDKVEELTGMSPAAAASASAVKHPPAAKPKKHEVKEESSLAAKSKIVLDLVQALDPFVVKIAQIKGVQAVFLTGLKGEIFHAAGPEAARSSETMKMLSESLAATWDFCRDPAFWVLEFEKGLIVFQTLAPKLFLAVFADASVTFGALRYTLDKNFPLIQKAAGPLAASFQEGSS